MLIVSELFIYPIKSLSGIGVPSALVTEMGFQCDRRWMLVDESNRFISQREIPMLALLHVSLTESGLDIKHKYNDTQLSVPYKPQVNECITVEIWEDVCTAQLVSSEANKWFSDILSVSCRLVYMREDVKRKVDPVYALNSEITSFSDGFPFLLVGQSSLDDLNARLTEPLPINRFRPNIVFTGGAPFEEDLLEHFIVGGIHFYGAKPCARCTITTTNQQTAEKGKEPLKTLATYRAVNNNVYFGQNLLHHGAGIIRVGDEMEVIKTRENSFMKHA